MFVPPQKPKYNRRRRKRFHSDIPVGGTPSSDEDDTPEVAPRHLEHRYRRFSSERSLEPLSPTREGRQYHRSSSRGRRRRISPSFSPLRDDRNLKFSSHRRGSISPVCRNQRNRENRAARPQTLPRSSLTPPESISRHHSGRGSLSPIYGDYEHRANRTEHRKGHTPRSLAQFPVAAVDEPSGGSISPIYGYERHRETQGAMSRKRRKSAVAKHKNDLVDEPGRLTHSHEERTGVYKFHHCDSCASWSQTHEFSNGKHMCLACIDQLQDLICSSCKDRLAIRLMDGDLHCQKCYTQKQNAKNKLCSMNFSFRCRPKKAVFDEVDQAEPEPGSLAKSNLKSCQRVKPPPQSHVYSTEVPRPPPYPVESITPGFSTDSEKKPVSNFSSPSTDSILPGCSSGLPEKSVKSLSSTVNSSNAEEHSQDAPKGIFAEYCQSHIKAFESRRSEKSGEKSPSPSPQCFIPAQFVHKCKSQKRVTSKPKVKDIIPDIPKKPRKSKPHDQRGSPSPSPIGNVEDLLSTNQTKGWELSCECLFGTIEVVPEEENCGIICDLQKTEYKIYKSDLNAIAHPKDGLSVRFRKCADEDGGLRAVAVDEFLPRLHEPVVSETTNCVEQYPVGNKDYLYRPNLQPYIDKNGNCILNDVVLIQRAKIVSDFGKLVCRHLDFDLYGNNDYVQSLLDVIPQMIIATLNEGEGHLIFGVQQQSNICYGLPLTDLQKSEIEDCLRITMIKDHFIRKEHFDVRWVQVCEAKGVALDLWVLKIGIHPGQLQGTFQFRRKILYPPELHADTRI